MLKIVLKQENPKRCKASLILILNLINGAYIQAEIKHHPLCSSAQNEICTNRKSNENQALDRSKNSLNLQQKWKNKQAVDIFVKAIDT